MNQKATKFFVALMLGCSLLPIAGCNPHQTGGPFLSAAPASATADNDIYVTEAGGRIRAFLPDGKEQWTLSLGDELVRLDPEASHDLEINYLAASSGGKLYGIATLITGQQAGRLVLFALDGKRLAWQHDVLAPEQGVAPLAIGADAIYEAGNDGVLYAFARSDGRALWQYRVSDATLGSPIVGANGTIYVTGPRNNLHAIASNGSQLWVVGS